VAVAWPWLQIDPSSRFRWDGTTAFPRDPESPDWRNIPWRIEPDGWELESGDNCMVGIPQIDVRIMWIKYFDPPGDFGWLPRPIWGLAVCPLQDWGDENAGYVMYLDTGEPVQIDVIGKSGE
jgi:hypothetical protein